LKTWQIVASCVICAGLAFGGGLLVGRQFPAHHYERLGQTAFLYDTTSGKTCNPFKDDNPYAAYQGQASQSDGAKFGDNLPKCDP
jgi:hypothetical protein